jgi:hypothetical protein
MINEDQKIKQATKRYIITFKRKDQTADKKSDKVDILKKVIGLRLRKLR